jgi:nitroimidazol reductase NimA-like FMN-containing flavoprotein (pyridoxamine 5'-phosphate oxidase superfamily)
MDKNQSTQPIHKIRRADRAVTDESWIKDFLKQAPYGMTATAIDEQPFLTTNLFAYDEDTNAIYLHSADKGRTASNIKTNERVCFSVSKMGRLLPAEKSCEFSVEYASVVVFGRAQILSDDIERAYGLQRLLDKYFPHLKPGEHYPNLSIKEMRGTAVYRIEIINWSGKQKKAPDDFPGSFSYGAQPASTKL